MTMIAALVALALGAVAGIYLATRHFLRKKLPALIALLHGLGGATGFTFVLLTVVREPTYRPIRDVLYLLIATVALGSVNLLFHVRGVRHRTSLILLHGLTAVTSAVMLIRAILLYVPPAESSALATTSQPETGGPPAAISSGPRTGEPSSAGIDRPQAKTEEKPADDTSKAKTHPDEPVLDVTVQRLLNQAVNFDTASANISSGSLASIAETAKSLKDHPEIALVEVQGHADERGEDGRNVALTRARAAAVVNALVANGVARSRLHSAGYGSRCPEDAACRRRDAPESCHSPASWPRDRRVVLLALQVGKTSFRGEVACARAVDLIPAEDQAFHVPDGKR